MDPNFSRSFSFHPPQQHKIRAKTNMSVPRHRAKKSENKLDNIVGAKIYYFWIVNAEISNINFWVSGTVVKAKNDAEHPGYYFIKFKKKLGRPTTLLIPLGKPDFFGLWYRADSATDGNLILKNTSSKVRTWVSTRQRMITESCLSM